MQSFVLGTDVTLQCYVAVSAFRNYNPCWYFTPMGTSDPGLIRCLANDSDYSLTLPSVTRDNRGTYQCRVRANTVLGLPTNNVLQSLKGPNIVLNVFGKCVFSCYLLVITSAYSVSIHSVGYERKGYY